MHDLIVWIQEVAVPKLGWFGMYLVAVADGSFITLPELSDLLIVTGAARAPGLAWKFILASALGSMTGCLLLYEAGRRGGEKFATRFVSEARLVKAKDLLARHGALAIAIPALSPPPVPFKGFVLAAGIFAMPRWRLALTVFLARGLRYVIWAVLGVVYGDRAIGWVKGLDTWMENHVFIVVGVLTVMIVALVMWWRSQPKPKTEAF